MNERDCSEELVHLDEILAFLLFLVSEPLSAMGISEDMVNVLLGFAMLSIEPP
jgi:hypothetical protein